MVVIKFTKKSKVIKIHLHSYPIKVEVDDEIFFRNNMRQVMREIENRTK